MTRPRSPFELTQIAIEPMRRGFVVDDGDLDQLVLAMRAANSLWAGQRGIIVPRLASGELAPGAVQMVEATGLDQLVDFSKRDDGPPPPAGSVPVIPARPFTDFRAWQPPPIVTFGLDEIVSSTIRFAAVDAGPFLTATFGSVADDGELEDWSSRHADVHEHQERDLTPAEIVRAQAEVQTAIATTVRHAPMHLAYAPFAQSLTLIWVVEDADTSFEELLWFWNMRALRPSDDGLTLLVRRSYFRDPECLSLLRELVSSRARMTPAVAINGLSFNRRALAGCARRLGFPRKQDSQWSENLFGDKPPSAVESAVAVEMRQFWLAERRLGLSTTAACPDPQVGPGRSPSSAACSHGSATLAGACTRAR